MAKKKSAWLWLLSLLITLLMVVYQRLSGPTYPLKGSETLGQVKVSYRFLRSWTANQSLPVRLAVSGAVQNVRLHHRRYPFIEDESWSVIPLIKNNELLQAEIPGQPPAGKVAYKVSLQSGAETLWLNHGRPAVARFKGKVPTLLLIIHVIFMFAGLLLGIRTGLEALRKNGKIENLVFSTLALVFLGGLILGPLVQYYAFGALWTGFPLGKDLTDNKTFLVVVLWAVAFFMQKKSRRWVIAAAVLMILVYLIPHSLLGSELDYKSQQIKTGFFKPANGASPLLKC